MSVKFPFFGGGFGGWGSADFIFMGARIFLTFVSSRNMAGEILLGVLGSVSVAMPRDSRQRKKTFINSVQTRCIVQQKRVYPYPLGAGSARPNPKMGAPDPENPLFLGFAVLRGGLRPWSQTMVSEGARPWGRGRSGDCEL